MSYLSLAAGVPDFSKAVISLWFRAPKESTVAAATSQLPAGVENFTMMESILPLVTFGRPQLQQIYLFPIKNVGHIIVYKPGEPPSSTVYLSPQIEKGPTCNVNPSFIGLQCYQNGQFDLIFNLQTASYMITSATGFITTGMSIWSGSDPGAPVHSAYPGGGAVSLGWEVGIATIVDSSYLDNAQPEFFTVISRAHFDPDEWHHLLLSFDIGGSVSVGTPFASSNCRLWYAIDDTDYRGAENLQPYRDTGGQWGPDTLDPNAILTRNAWRLSGWDPNWEAVKYYQNQPIPNPRGNWDGGSVPSGDAPVGIPASAQYVNGIFRCEMAEFQLFTGVTLDTGVTNNRRAFVDGDGKPVKPVGEFNKEGAQIEQAPAEKLLGKPPEILLHGSNKWKAGKNTGSLGWTIDSEGNVIELPAGQFKATGKIERYKPDPSLEEEPTA